MRHRLISLELDPHSRTPVTLQIVTALIAAMRDGRLGPGDALPSTRLLAESLKVSRNTVLDAYDELASEGYVVGRHGSGSYVADPLPTPLARSLDYLPPDRLAFPLAATPNIQDLPPTVLSCQTGQADPRLLPTAALARAYRKALESRATATPRQKDLASEGHLRAQLLHLLRQTAGLGGTQGNLLLTSGFHAALRLVAESLLEPGDVVAVEGLGALRHWETLRAAGASLEPIPVESTGISVEALQALGRSRKLRAVLLSPRCQYPTTVALSPEKRGELLRWASAQGVALLECDAESGIHFGHATPVALAAEDRAGSVIYLGSFAKALFPGLPLAYVHAPTPMVAHLAARQNLQQAGADPVFEGAMVDLFLEGEFHRHLARLRTALRLRRDALCAAVQDHLAPWVDYQVPDMGMALWIGVHDQVDVEAWAARSVAKGVAFTVGRRYRFDGGSLQALRLGFASHEEGELRQVVTRMAAALPAKP